MRSLELKNDIKIIVIGAPGTGKTSYVSRWTKNVFSDNYKATIVSDFGFKIFEEGDKLYRIQIWDLAGQDSSERLAKIFVKDTDGCIIMSDATNLETREK